MIEKVAIKIENLLENSRLIEESRLIEDSRSTRLCRCFPGRLLGRIGDFQNEGKILCLSLIV